MNTKVNENGRVKKLKASHRTIYTDIEIDASPEQVWSVLTDTASYKRWGAFLVDIQGEIRDGNSITAVFQIDPKKEKRTTIEHTISVTDGTEFYWAEKGPGGITDNHHFKVEALGNGKTRFIQSDEIKGGITWLMGGNLSKMYEKGYQAFNRNLKTEVETKAPLEANTHLRIMNFNLENIPTQEGRIALVTGANNGIGYETTLAMADYGFKVVMACRNMEKAQKAKADILKQVPGADLHILQLDLSDLSSVRTFAKNFKNNFAQLDVLINNAGVLVYSGKKNKAGIEMQFATNHLGHFLLTNLLLNLIPDDHSSRIVALSSIAHKTAKIHFDDLNCEKAKIENKDAAYGQSKLANLMFADELNRRLKRANKKMVALAVHPGGSDSGLFDEMARVKYYTFKILSPFILNSTASAAKPSLFAALSAEVHGGEYFGPQGFNEFKGKVGLAKRSDYSKREDIASRLWKLSEEMTDEAFLS